MQDPGPSMTKYQTDETAHKMGQRNSQNAKTFRCSHALTLGSAGSEDDSRCWPLGCRPGCAGCEVGLPVGGGLDGLGGSMAGWAGCWPAGGS